MTRNTPTDVLLSVAAPSPALPLAAALVLLTAIHVCYVIGASTGYVEWCMPYVDGCTSISKASRNPPAVFVYRSMISLAGALLAIYWLSWSRWLAALGARRLATRSLATLGVIASICLIANAAILGEEERALRILRRIFVIVFFFFTFVACALSALGLATARRAAARPGLVRAKLVIVALMAGLGVFHYAVMPFVDGLAPYEDQLQNATEWQWVALVGAYVAATTLAWRDAASR